MSLPSHDPAPYLPKLPRRVSHVSKNWHLIQFWSDIIALIWFYAIIILYENYGNTIGWFISVSCSLLFYTLILAISMNFIGSPRPNTIFCMTMLISSAIVFVFSYQEQFPIRISNELSYLLEQTQMLIFISQLYIPILLIL